MTPDEYRARYNLKSDYPMVAPSYSEARRTMAKSIGLGRKPGQKGCKPADEAPKAVCGSSVKHAICRLKSQWVRIEPSGFP